MSRLGFGTLMLILFGFLMCQPDIPDQPLVPTAKEQRTLDSILQAKKLAEENKRKEEEKKEEDADENEAETDDVFASFKSYNQSTQDKVQKEKTELTRNDIVCDKANKYLHRGKVKEAIFGEKPVKVTKQATSSMSFSSWKLWKSSEDKKDKQV